MAWCQSSSKPKVSKIALCIWRFERHTTENPTFLERQASHEFLGAAGRVGTDHDGAFD